MSMCMDTDIPLVGDVILDTCALVTYWYGHTLMFPDTQIKEENFLEDVGNLLNTGEVPNMFPIDEKNEICSKMRQIDK